MLSEESKLDTTKFKFEVQIANLDRPSAELGAQYEKKLGELRTAARDRGDLTSVLAVDKELENYKATGSPTTKRVPALAPAQSDYVRSKQRLDAKRDKQRAALYETYLKQLGEMEAAFAKGGEAEEAQAVHSVRETALADLKRVRTKLMFKPGYKMRGRFHVEVDDKVRIYRDGEVLYAVPKRGRGVSPVCELVIGDRLLASTRNSGGGIRHFKVVFVSEDEQHMINFRVADFRDFAKVLGKRREFTSGEFERGDGQPARRDVDKSGNPFDFENGSEWVWGRRHHALLGTIISADMCSSR